ncbi:MAG: cache domain-containing protein [Anaerolineae bacterium]|jgi:two-component system NtrC family sensor kinase
MAKLLARLVSWRLQYVLVIGFVITTAVTIIVGTLMTYRVINNYLESAADARVGRDMDLANAFYNTKMHDISSMASRIAAGRCVQHNLAAASAGDQEARLVILDEIETEITNLPHGTQRFAVLTDIDGRTVIGQTSVEEHLRPAQSGTDWSSLPIVADVLREGRAQSATEVVPASILSWMGLEDQARIPLLETEKAAPEPFDPREGTAGLVLMAVAPVFSEDGESVGSVVVGHLFNNDFILVDRIKEVAGVDTVTIFFGDLRVSTNVLNEQSERVIGTRVSQEVFDTVLVNGQPFAGPAYVFNQWYITRYDPLHDHQGQVVGMLYVGAKQAAFQQLLDSFRNQVFLVAAATAVLASLLAIPLAWSIARPLTEMAGATRKVAEGDWSVRVPVYGHGEIGVLAESFNTMVETLEMTQDQLVQKEKLASVGQLAAGVAHEINNPLGSILLYADILRKETPRDNQQQKEDLEMIIRETTRCKTIVNDLLNFSRQNEVLVRETDLNRLLEDLTDEASKRELFDQVEIIQDLDPELPLIQADPLQLRQVFLNLMNNAAEAMPTGGRLTLRTRNEPEEGMISAYVKDTGVGISEENMKKIFTPFFTTKPIGKGTGLGLAITYGIVKMHRGQISVESEVGKGTTFLISLRTALPLRMERMNNTKFLQ